jgi:pimeloyl-ACP methyl ester carboxylesterase
MTNERGSIQNSRGATGNADGATPPKTSTPTLADGQSHFVTHGADQIHYVTIGQGDHTFVFVHGWACHLGFWREQIAALSPGARLVLIDLPGHGHSDKPQTDYTMDFFADAVLAVLHDAKVEKATFVGHSMGKAVICRVCKLAPEKVAALVSVDGLLRRPVGVPGEAEAMVAQFHSPHYRAVAKGFVHNFFPIVGTEALRDEVTAEVLLTPQNVMASAMAGMLDPRQPDWDLKQVAVPVLVLNAKGSLWVADYENYVRTLSPQTEYRLFENAGHWLMLEQPVEFNAALTAMLRKYDLMAK